MNLFINGKTVNVEGYNLSIPELLKKIDVDSPEMVTVEVNGEIIYRDAYRTFRIKEGDRVEFLYFMGGGEI